MLGPYRADKGGEYSEGETGDWTVIYLRGQQWCRLRGHGVEWLRTRCQRQCPPGLRSFLSYFLDSCLSVPQEIQGVGCSPRLPSSTTHLSDILTPYSRAVRRQKKVIRICPTLK